MRRLLVPVALLVLAALALATWSRRIEGPPVDLAWTGVAEVTTLDPARMTAVQDGRVAAALWEGLTVLDPADLRPKPGVASRWDVSDDGLTYTFHLRPEARWSDGRPVTAEDFVYAWRRALDPATGAEYAYMLWPIRGAKAHYEALARGDPPDWAAVGFRAEGPHTLVVALAQPTPYFADLAAFSTYLPLRRDVVEAPDGSPRRRWTFPPHLVTNGPYVLRAWHFRSRMRWQKNPHYWDAGSVALERIEVRVYEDPNTALLAYETGAVDLATEVPALAKLPLLEAARAGRRRDVRHGSNLATYFYRLNCTAAPLADVRVRRALALAVDRRAIIDRAARGGQLPARTLVPPGMAGYTRPAGLAEDAEAARRLLADAGYPGGAGLPVLELLVNKGGGHVPVAELIQQQWLDRLGVQTRIEQVEWKVFLDRVSALDYEIARAGWFGDYVDPNTFLDMFVTGGGNNRTGWSSAVYDGLIRRAAETTDRVRRMAVLAEAEARLLAEGPIVPLYHYTSLVLVRPDLDGFQTNLLNRIDFARLSR